MRLDELIRLMPPGFLSGTVIIFGLLWGSFLNVVIHRVPREMSVVRPASHCPGCGKPIAPYDNIPVVSWVILRGRARCCGARMSPRYLLVELIGGALSLAIFQLVVAQLPGGTSATRALAIYGADFVLTMGLVAAAFIDAEHMFLPDTIMYGGIVLGIFTASFREMTLLESIIGAGAGFLGIYIPFIFLYKGLLGRTGMGLGDAKLLALAGAWFGWPGALFTLMAGAVQGSTYALGMRIAGIEQKLPAAVLADIAELEKAAAEGDEEAKQALAEDPLTEDESDAFIVRFFQRIFGGSKSEEPEATAPPESKESEAGETEDGEEEEDAAPRARIPFGPFLILAILELLFAGNWLKEHLVPFLWPVF